MSAAAAPGPAAVAAALTDALAGWLRNPDAADLAVRLRGLLSQLAPEGPS